MIIMAIATVSSKGQIVIPKEIREAFGIHPGDKVNFMQHQDHIHVTKVGDPLEAFLSGPRVHLKQGDVEKMLKERF